MSCLISCCFANWDDDVLICICRECGVECWQELVYKHWFSLVSHWALIGKTRSGTSHPWFYIYMIPISNERLGVSSKVHSVYLQTSEDLVDIKFQFDLSACACMFYYFFYQLFCKLILMCLILHSYSHKYWGFIFIV